MKAVVATEVLETTQRRLWLVPRAILGNCHGMEGTP